MTPLILNLSFRRNCSTSRLDRFVPGAKTPVPIEQGMGWASNLVWTFYGKRKILCSRRDSNSGSSSPYYTRYVAIFPGSVLDKTIFKTNLLKHRGLIHIQEVPGSNLGLKTSYPVTFKWSSSVPQNFIFVGVLLEMSPTFPFASFPFHYQVLILSSEGLEYETVSIVKWTTYKYITFGFRIYTSLKRSI